MDKIISYKIYLRKAQKPSTCNIISPFYSASLAKVLPTLYGLLVSWFFLMLIDHVI